MILSHHRTCRCRRPSPDLPSLTSEPSARETKISPPNSEWTPVKRWMGRTFAPTSVGALPAPAPRSLPKPTTGNPAGRDAVRATASGSPRTRLVPPGRRKGLEGGPRLARVGGAGGRAGALHSTGATAPVGAHVIFSSSTVPPIPPRPRHVCYSPILSPTRKLLPSAVQVQRVAHLAMRVCYVCRHRMRTLVL